MEKQLEIEYTQIGDYLYPKLSTANENLPELTRYGLARRNFLREQSPFDLEVLGAKAYPHFIEIQEQAEELHKNIMESKVREAEKSGEMPKDLRQKDAMAWMRIMERLEAETVSQVMRDLVKVPIGGIAVEPNFV